MIKIKELREKTEEELQLRIEEIEREYFALRSKLKVERKLEKPHQLKDLKKEKAKILTILGARSGK